jgi:hypothetical protein
MVANTAHSGSGRGFALAASAFTTFVLFPGFTVVAEERKSETIGPWTIESVFKVYRCSINRTLKDDIVVTFVRTGEGLSLELQSPNWKLEDGKHYPVKMTLGPLTIDTEVAARPNSVSTEIKDEKFAAGLRSASALNVTLEPRSTCRSTKARSRSTGSKNASRRTIARTKTTLLSHPHVSPSHWRVGGRGLQ